jgi:transcription initiation factor TFIID subunit TAF12
VGLPRIEGSAVNKVNYNQKKKKKQKQKQQQQQLKRRNCVPAQRIVHAAL